MTPDRKIALVGVGYWGEKLLRNLATLVDQESIVAVDVLPERHRALAPAYPAVAFTDSLEAAVEDRQVAGVIIATPVVTHATLARQALEAGCHVLVEKPLAASAPEAREIVLLGQARGLTVMAGHTFLFSPRVETVKSTLERGQIGRVHYATTSRLNLGLYRRDIDVIWDLAPHDFSIVFHLFGERPTIVQTTAQSSVGTGVPDVAFINLTFPSGAIASVLVSWRAPKKVRNIVVVGDQGMIVYDDTQPDEPVKIYDRGVVSEESANFGEHQLTYRYGDTVSPYISAQEPLTRELAHFLSCMDASGQHCISDGWFGLEVVKALEAAERSWRLGGIPVAVGASPAAA
jgi:predicted dehydrogenase